MANTKRRGVILTVAGVILACIAAVLAFGYLNRIEREIGEKVEIVIATEDIAARTLITEDMLGYDEIPARYVRDSYLRDIYEAVGQVAMIDINKDDILHRNALAAGLRLEPGMRAVSIDVDEVTGVGGLLSPGDRVDIIVSYVTRTDINRSEMMWKDVQVLAVGSASSVSSSMGPIPSDAILPPEESSTMVRTVTLALSPGDAVKLTYMSNFGKQVRLVIRSKADLETPVVSPITSEDFD